MLGVLFAAALAAAAPAATTPFPVPDADIARYTAARASGPIAVDGRLDEDAWRKAARTARFVDLVSGAPVRYETTAAILWDDECLYIGFWVEEPEVAARQTERDAPVYYERDVEVFIAGADAYYEFEINALNTIYEGFFIWQDAYARGGYDAVPELRATHPKAQPFNGVGFRQHPRGPRLGCFGWDFPGLKSAVHVVGTLNQPGDEDRQWTVELAFPWSGMAWLAKGDGRSLPPKPDDVWRINLMRFNPVKAPPPAKDSGGWAWSRHGVWDSHIPEVFPYVRFAPLPPPN